MRLTWTNGCTIDLQGRSGIRGCGIHVLAAGSNTDFKQRWAALDGWHSIGLTWRRPHSIDAEAIWVPTYH